MLSDSRINNEIKHGAYITGKGEEIWNWSTPAGKIRWQRRCKLFQALLGNNGAKVLEVGCGTGLFTQELAKTKNIISAIDISPDLIARARNRVKNGDVVFSVVNAQQTNFPDGFFDFIVGSSVLHHLDAAEALKEFFRILRPGGRLMFTEPNMLNPQIAAQKNIPWLKRVAGDSPDETAFFRWAITKKLKQLGFRQVKVRPFDFLHPAIPAPLIPLFKPLADVAEKIPLFKEIAGSLVITAEK